MRLSHTFLLLSVLAVLIPYARAQESERPLPKVIQHAEPSYPPLAQQARISGEVRVKFATDGESVIHVEAETGHPLLARAAEQNVSTWKFAAHEPGTFDVTFRYRYQEGATDVVFLPSSSTVELTAALPIVSLDNYATVDLGKWRAQLKTARSSFQWVLTLETGGYLAGGTWLHGEALGGQGEKEKLTFGYFDEKRDMLGFTIMHRQTGGKTLNTFFVGKIKGDRMVGTFVDDEGMTGQWTAVREKQPANTNRFAQ